MVIRLNPRYPLVWRSPDTIQLGIDRPLVVLAGVTAPLENVIAALRGGVPRAGAMMLGREAGASDAAVSALLTALGPALLSTNEADTVTDTRAEATGAAAARTTHETGATAGRPAVVCVDGRGPTAERIRAMLGELGIPTGPTDADPALAVLIGHFALEPARHGHWLRRDIPHLAVVFSDSEVRVGPLVEPGEGPCLYCLDLARVDADPAWPAIACQLLARQAQTETARTSIEVATRVCGLVQDRLAFGRSELAATSLAIDAHTGALRRRAHRPHERCGCRSLPENAIVPGGRDGPVPLPTSSGPAAGVPA